MSDYDPNDDGTRYDPWTREEFTVVWSGGALLGPRDTRVTDPNWTKARRIYNKKVESTPSKAVDIPEALGDEIDQKFVVVSTNPGGDDGDEW